MEPQKDLRYYFQVLLNRKKYFIIPTLLGFSIAAALALLLPPVFESSSTILIEEQQIPQEFVRSTVTGFADQRIQSLTQQILSRTKLLEIIQQFNLYPEMQDKFTREEIIETMRQNIKINTISAEVAGGAKGRAGGAMTIAFSISYRGRSPDTVQKVAGTLASLYLEQNLKAREQQAKTTTQFLEAELRELQERIKDFGGKIAEFKKKNEGILPELQSFNMQQMERMEGEIRQIDVQIKAIEDRKGYLEGQLVIIKPELTTITAAGEKVMDPKSRLKMLKLVLAELQSKFSEDHPDIRKTRREMAELEKMVKSKDDRLSEKTEKRAALMAALADKQGKYSEQHPDVQKLQKELKLLEKEDAGEDLDKKDSSDFNPQYLALKGQIKQAENDIATLLRQKANIQEKLKIFRQRCEEGPKVEQDYLALMRNYQNAHNKHQEILNKLMEARIAEGMEEHQKAEKFTLIDPASYPEKPVSPKRLMILVAGLVLSLGSGIGIVVLAEHLDHSVKSPEELSFLTGVPVIGAIPLIQTVEDKARKVFRRRLILLLGSLSVICGLSVFHFYYRDLWIFAAKLMRLINKHI